MAKVRPFPSLEYIEERLGFRASDLGRSTDHGHIHRLYSDFRPIPRSFGELMLKELEEHDRNENHLNSQDFLDRELLAVGRVKFIETSQSTVRVECISPVGFYRFLVDVDFTFGLKLSTLLSCHEVHRILILSQLRLNILSSIDSTSSKLFNLPLEIREKIYDFALDGVQPSFDKHSVTHQGPCALAEGIGDPSGFYYQLPTYSPLLFLNRQIRAEALPIAFRKLSLAATDIDGLVKLLISIGDIGRRNLRSIACNWESRSEMEMGWVSNASPGDPALVLPQVHVVKAGHLLRQCRRLKHLRLCIDEDCLDRLTLDAFRADTGIKELCSMHRIETVEIFDSEHQPIEHNELVEWLKREMQKRTG